MINPLGSRAILHVDDQDYTYFRLEKTYAPHPTARRLPYSLKILLETLLRGAADNPMAVREEDVAALADWSPPPGQQPGAPAAPPREIAFMPARVLLQDF